MNTPSLTTPKAPFVSKSTAQKAVQAVQFTGVSNDDFDPSASEAALGDDVSVDEAPSLADKARGLLKENLSEAQANMEGTQTQLRSGFSQAKTVVLDGFKWNKLFSEANPTTDLPQRLVSITTLAFTQFLDGFKGSRTEAIKEDSSSFPSNKMIFHLYTELLSQYPHLLLKTDAMPLNLVEQAINTHPFDNKNNVQERFNALIEKAASVESIEELDMKTEMRAVFFPKK